jgi:hypothetical protein
MNGHCVLAETESRHLPHTEEDDWEISGDTTGSLAQHNRPATVDGKCDNVPHSNMVMMVCHRPH